MLEKEHKPYGLSPWHSLADRIVCAIYMILTMKHKDVIVLIIFIHLFNALCVESLFFSLPKGKVSLKKLDKTFISKNWVYTQHI